MIKLNPAPTFTTDVELTVPGNEKTAKAGFVFKYMTLEENKAFWEEKGSDEKRKVSDCLHELVEDWSGFDVPYSPENFKILLKHYPAAAGEILSQYNKALFASRVKN